MSISPEEKKDRARWQRIFRVYGITKEQYDELDQGFCPICLREWSEKVRPCVDHEHSTDLWVRGVVCLYCNHRIIGRHKDADMIQRVADYLRGPFKYQAPPKKKKKRRPKKAKGE